MNEEKLLDYKTILKEKEPWLAVLLSRIFPGLGQFYAGNRWKALIISLSTVGSLSWGLWNLLSRQGDTQQGWIIFLLSICLYIGNLFDAWFGVKKWNVNLGKTEKRKKKGPYLAIFLTTIFPGLGNLYLKQFKIGIIFIVVSLALPFLGFERMVLPLIETLLLSIVYWHIFGKRQSIFKVNKVIQVIVVVLIIENLCISSIFGYAVDHWIRVNRLSGYSSSPTIMEGDVVIENMQIKNNLKIGKFISFSYQDPLDKKKYFLMKRLIGLEGQEIYIDSGAVYINGCKLTEYPFSHMFYSSDSTCLYATRQNPYIVPPNCIFVLGDNSSRSTDSRHWGGIDKSKIISVAYKVIWPYDRIKTLEP